MITGALSFCIFLKSDIIFLCFLHLDSDDFHYTMMKHRIRCLSTLAHYHC